MPKNYSWWKRLHDYQCWGTMKILPLDGDFTGVLDLLGVIYFIMLLTLPFFGINLQLMVE